MISYGSQLYTGIGSFCELTREPRFSNRKDGAVTISRHRVRVVKEMD